MSLSSSSSLPIGLSLLYIGTRTFPSPGSFVLVLAAFLLLVKQRSSLRAISKYDAWKGLSLGAVGAIVVVWQWSVRRVVVEAYLDEVFHIPQAQAYCTGDWFTWDPKLTTPPGLYFFSVFLIQALGRLQCSVGNLRAFNGLALIAAMVYACDCRTLLRDSWQRGNSASRLLRTEVGVKRSFGDFHTAVNIALFPPLFFFSGLYYTDILSTCVVVLAFKLFLQRGYSSPSLGGAVLAYFVGVVGLAMRQTNIFWVAVFLGGLEAVRSVNSDVIGKTPPPQSFQEFIQSAFRWGDQAQIFDIPLGDARVMDFALCAITFAAAVIKNPLTFLRKLWPHLALIVSFAAFVALNGGVVLGDKSNHVATIHFPQLLYLWPFITFFSWPILLPSALKFILSSISTILFLVQPSPVPKLPTIRRLALPLLTATLGLFSTLLIVHFNTIIHPFTLADNRHYVFYVFRYTILRHRLVRYFLAPIYILCFYLCYLALCASLLTSSDLATAKNPRRTAQQQRIIATTTSLFPTATRTQTETSAAAGPTTSFFLVWLLSTALSLITAPLVEPRYFIIPWLLWRLHIPSSPSSSSLPSASTNIQRPKSSGSKEANQSAKKSDNLSKIELGPPGSGATFYDHRLWAETAWFLLVNVVTGYVFLYRGFEWASEPGMVQRFMW